MAQTWFITGSSVGLGYSIVEAAPIESDVGGSFLGESPVQGLSSLSPWPASFMNSSLMDIACPSA